MHACVTLFIIDQSFTEINKVEGSLGGIEPLTSVPQNDYIC